MAEDDTWDIADYLLTCMLYLINGIYNVIRCCLLIQLQWDEAEGLQGITMNVVGEETASRGEGGAMTAEGEGATSAVGVEALDVVLAPAKVFFHNKLNARSLHLLIPYTFWFITTGSRDEANYFERVSPINNNASPDTTCGESLVLV